MEQGWNAQLTPELDWVPRGENPLVLPTANGSSPGSFTRHSRLSLAAITDPPVVGSCSLSHSPLSPDQLCVLPGCPMVTLHLLHTPVAPEGAKISSQVWPEPGNRTPERHHLYPGFETPSSGTKATTRLKSSALVLRTTGQGLPLDLSVAQSLAQHQHGADARGRTWNLNPGISEQPSDHLLSTALASPCRRQRGTSPS